MDNDVIVKIPKLHLSTRTEFGNNDFQNQRTQASKNTYVAKNQTKKNACGCHILVSRVPDYTAQKSVNYRIINNKAAIFAMKSFIFPLTGYPSNGKL